MLTVFIFLAVAAAVCTVLNAITPSKCPLWVPVLLICVIELLRALPLGASH